MAAPQFAPDGALSLPPSPWSYWRVPHPVPVYLSTAVNAVPIFITDHPAAQLVYFSNEPEATPVCYSAAPDARPVIVVPHP